MTVIYSGGAGENVMRDTSTSPRVVQFGSFEADLGAEELRKSGVKIRLHGQPFQVLALLLGRPGDLITREELQRQLWPGDTFVNFDHGLNTAISRIREILGDSATTPRFIETVPRRGYRFIAPVSQRGMDTANDASPVKPHSFPVLPLISKRRLLWLIPAGGLSVLGLLLLTGVTEFTPGSGRTDRFTARSLAVLPFENLTGDPEQQYFCDGMTDILISDLGAGRTLPVISRTSVLQFQGTRKPLPEIARELQVTHIVEGSVLRVDDRVRITAQLIEAANDRHLWSKSFEREFRDILELQREVAQAISAELRLDFEVRRRVEQSSTRASDADAHIALLKGGHFYRQGQPDAGLAYLEEAATRAPNYARAHTALAWAYYFRAWHQSYPPQVAMEKARAAALRALEIDDGIAEAHAALGAVYMDYDWDWNAAENSFRDALQLNPSLAPAHRYYGLLLTIQGHNAEAHSQMQTAVKLDPLAAFAHHYLGWHYYATRQYDRAIQSQLKTLEIHPKSSSAYVHLGWLYSLKGDFSRAIENVKRGIREDGSDSIRAKAWLGLIYALSGDHDQARKVIADLGGSSPARYVSPVIAGLTYEALGDRASALTQLERGFDERDPWTAELPVTPFADSLRSEPRFVALMERLRLDQRRSGLSSPN